MKYKIALGVIGTVIAFQGVMASRDVGVKKQLGVGRGCMNCHKSGGGAHLLTDEERTAGLPQDANHQLLEAEIKAIEAHRAAPEHERTGVVDTTLGRKLA